MLLARRAAALLASLVIAATSALADGRSMMIGVSGSGAAAVPTATPTATPAGITVASYYTAPTVQYAFDLSDTAKVLNPSAASAANGEKIATVNPVTGTLTLAQSTDANRPLLTTNISNGKQGATVTGSPQVFRVTGAGNRDIIRNTAKVSKIAVFRVNSTAAGNLSFLRYYDGGWNDVRVRFFISGASSFPSLDATRIDANAPSTLNSATVLATGTPHVVLWEIDLTTGVCTIYADSAVTSVNGTACAGGAGTFEDVTSGDTGGPEILLTGSVDLFFTSLVTNDLMTGAGRTAMWADMKSRYGITAY